MGQGIVSLNNVKHAEMIILLFMSIPDRAINFHLYVQKEKLVRVISVLKIVALINNAPMIGKNASIKSAVILANNNVQKELVYLVNVIIKNHQEIAKISIN